MKTSVVESERDIVPVGPWTHSGTAIAPGLGAGGARRRRVGSQFLEQVEQGAGSAGRLEFLPQPMQQMGLPFAEIVDDRRSAFRMEAEPQ